MEGKGNYLTLKEAAEQLGVHPNTLRNWERRGVIRLEQRPGSRYRRVPVYEVQRLEGKRPLEAASGDAQQELSTETWHVRIDWPTHDPAVMARGEALGQQIQAELAQIESEETLEDTMARLRGYAWLS